jgi:hypothetical protein
MDKYKAVSTDDDIILPLGSLVHELVPKVLTSKVQKGTTAVVRPCTSTAVEVQMYTAVQL